MTEQASEFWDKEVVEKTHVSWMEDPVVRAYINQSISGSAHVWPIDWLQTWLAGRRFQRALSVGCGSGPLERDLLRRDLCDFLDAFDGSPHSIELATREAASAGLADRVHYYVSDFNEPRLPKDTYGAVFFHQSLHHVGKLEKLLKAVHGSLKTGGLLYLDEYIGPSRSDWDDQTIALHRAFYEMLPRSIRTTDKLPLPIHPVDPSEALRSGEIMEQLKVGFEILECREYGGTLLSVLYPALRGSVESPVPILDLIAAETALRANGRNSYHVVVVARPKEGFAGALARANYYVTPKMKRIGRTTKELIRRVRPNFP